MYNYFDSDIIEKISIIIKRHFKMKILFTFFSRKNNFFLLLKKLNPYNAEATEDLVSVVSLEAIAPEDEQALKEMPDKKFYLGMDFNPVHNLKYHHPDYYPFPLPVPPKGGVDSAQINYITDIRPPAPLLTQYKDVPQVFRNYKNITPFMI